MKTPVIFYGTSACHLCEEAHLILQPIADSAGLDLIEIDISGDDALEENYGLRIPVIAFLKKELGWPFDSDTVQQFLRIHKN